MLKHAVRRELLVLIDAGRRRHANDLRAGCAFERARAR